MKFSKICLIVLFIFSFTGNISAQSEKEADVKKIIELFFKGLQSGDTITLKKTLASDAILQTTHINKDGESVLEKLDINKFLKSIASKKPEDVWEEKLLSYTIQIDGSMANVWTPYEFYLNYKFSHCGVNSFQLFHNGEKWNIIYLIDTRRRLGCNK